MTTQARAVLDQALRLDAVERAELIEALFRSFDQADTGSRDAAWKQEAESRIAAYEERKIGAVSAEELLKRVGK